MYLYDYEFTVTPRVSVFNSRSLRPLSFRGFVYRAKNLKAATRKFVKTQFPVARKNGVVRGKNQLLDCLTVKRISKHEA